MMRNGCLILCQFQIPADVIFDYQRLVSLPFTCNAIVVPLLTSFPQVEILLHIVSDYSDEDRFNQRAGIFLLNQLACQVQTGLIF